MPEKYYIDGKGNIRVVPDGKEQKFLSKYPGSREATNKELSDFENKRAEMQSSTGRESNIQNGQGSSTAKTTANQPLNGFNFDFGANQPQKMKTKFKDGTEGYVNIPTVNTNIPQLKEPNLLDNSAFKGKPLKETISDTMQNMPISNEAYFDMAVDRYKQEKDYIEQIRRDNTLSENVKQSLINDYQNNIRTSDLTVEDKDLPPAAKDWLERNKVSREVTQYNPSIMGGGSYTTTVRENTPEQIAFIKDYIANSEDGKRYAQAHKEFIGQLEGQADTLLNQIEGIRETSKKNKEEYAKRHNISTWTLKSTNYRNDNILDKSANLLKNTKLLLSANREGGGFWKGLHMTNEDLKELAVLTESFYNDKVLNQVIDKYQKDPNSLSKEENIIIQAKYIADQITAGVDPGSWYNIGATTKQSLPFMRDFILTAPIGGGVASGVKSGLSALASKTGANFLLSRGAGGVVSNLAKGAIDLSVRPAVQTMFSPSSYAMAFEEMQGQAVNKDAQGNIIFDNRKTQGHGMTSAFIENQSEVLGEVVLDKLFQKFRIPVPKFLKTNAAKRLSSATGIQGPITEYAEEKYSDLANIFRGEQTIEGFFDPRQNLETFGAVAIMQIPFSAINSTGYGIGKIRDAQATRAIRQTYDKSRSNLNEFFGQDAEVATENFNSLVDNSTEEELRNELISVIEDERLDDNAKRAIVEYVTAYSAYSGINKAKQEEVTQVQEETTQQVQENVNPQMNAVVSATIAGFDNPVQIMGGSIVQREDGSIDREASDKQIFYVDPNDGSRKVIAIDYVEAVDENIPTEEATAQLSELAAQEVTARHENEEVREYQAGERIRTIDGAIGRIAENEDGSVMTDANGNYILLVDTPAGPQQIATEPRNIVNEDNLIGVENGSNVTYTNEQGQKVQGIVSTSADLYAQGLIAFENGDVIPIADVVGLVQEEEQLPPPPADMMIGENGPVPYNPNVSNSQDSTQTGEQNEQSVTPSPSEQINLSLDQIPKDEKGNILFDSVSVENTISALGEVYETPEIPGVVDATIDNIGKQIEKIKSPKPSGDITKDIANRRAANQQLEVLNNRLSYWNDVKGVIQQSKPVKQQVTEQLTGEPTVNSKQLSVNNEEPQPITEQTKPRARKETPFQRRLNAVEDNVHTVRDRILFGIASGAYKFRWKDKGVSMGLAREMGLSGSEAERKSRIGILRNDGYTPSTLAHRIWEETGGELNDNDIRSEVIDVLSSISSRAQALEELEKSAGITEEQYLQEQAEASEYELQLRAEVEARYNEILDQLIEDDLVSLEDEAVSLGATSEQIADVITPTDFIDLIEQLQDGQEERQTSNERRNNEQTENIESEGNNDQRTQRTVGERNRSEEKTGDSRQDSDSTGNGINLSEDEKTENTTFGIVSSNEEINRREDSTDGISEKSDARLLLSSDLSPEEQRVVNEATEEIDAAIAEAQKELTTQQKELSSARKRLGKAQADTQGSLFGNEQQSTLFDVPVDLSKKNAVDNILTPIQQQIDIAQTNLDNLTNIRDARIQEALDNYRKQGNLLDEIARAEAETDTNPTEAQKEAGNYKKGKVTIQGFNISIEQPQGSVRSGVDANGKEWSITMNNTYGYILGTEGKDGDHIDLFLGNNPESNQVFVVDQMNLDGSFDEHKVMFGFNTIDEAREAYLSNYEEGWQGLGNITQSDMDTFKKWAKSDTRKIKPFAEYKEIQEAGYIPYNFSQEMIDYNREHGANILPIGDNTTVSFEVVEDNGIYYIGAVIEGHDTPFRIREGFNSKEEAEEYLINRTEEIDNLWWDMQDILENKEVSTPAYGASNTLVSADRYEELKKQMRDKLNNQLNTGIDPEVFVIGAQMAMYHIEAGARKFADFSSRMIEDLGDNVRPFLKSFYEGARHYPAETMKELSKEMDNSKFVSNFDIDNFNSEDYAKREPVNIQSDGQELRDREQVDQGTVPSESTESGQDANGFMADDVRKVVSDNQVPREDGSIDNSGRSDTLFSEEDYQRVSDGQPELSTTDSGDTRGSDTDVVGRQDDGQGESATVASESQRSDEETNVVDRQRSIKNADVVLSDINNIRETLPVLKPEQQQDVQKAEKRYFTGAGQNNEVGAGMLFTNGTGTGKTFTGVGIIKRFLLRGIDDIIITVPNQKIASDWIATADTFFDEQFTLLNDTKDQGRGVIVTTYANYRQNEALNNRQWALMVYDECHYLNQNASGNPTAAQKQDGILGINISEAKALAEERIGHERPVAPIRPEEMFTLETRYSWYGKKEYTPEYIQYEKDYEKYSKEKEQFDERFLNLAKEIHENRPKKLYLSATPFAYHKSLSYADGSLFVINETFDSSEDYQGYNVPDRWESFMVENFGYRMRYNKLTVPENAAAVSRLEQLFHEKLVSSGAVSGRSIDVPYDYSRDFVVVQSGVGSKIDEGIHAIWNDKRISILNNVLNKKWNYIKRAQFLEAAKSQGVKEHVDNLLANGYKVVIFHDFIKGNTQNPLHFDKIDDIHSVSLSVLELARLDSLRRKFDSESAEMTDEEILELQDLEDIVSNNELESILSNREKIEAYNKAVDIWNSEYSQYANLDFSDIEKPLTFFSREYEGRIGLFNGRETKRKRLRVADEFNKDDSGIDVILVQRQAGKEGISFHDTTGNKPRVLINLGLPTAPTDAIQIEGRTYRIGLQSNTAFQYPILNTSYEAMAFAHKIASRSKTAENLALGTRARKLEDAFKNGYQNPIYVEDIDYETIGEGSKEIDKFDEVEVSPYRDAVALFSTVLKNTKRRENREGKDYFATPEPVGFKMVEWLQSKDNDSVLEPSAGHGAIARFFNPNITATAVEPSYELATRLRLNTTAEVKQHTFEDLHIVNKYDGIVMNPPFGVGGKTAIEHVEKAFKHLRTNGRMIAIIPNGGATEKRFNAFMESKDAKDAFLRATYILPGVAFKNAGTNISTKVVIIDKVADPKLITDYAPTYDYSRIDNIDELFDRLEFLEAPERIYDTEGNNPPPTKRVGYYDIVEPSYESEAETVTEEVEEGVVASIEDYTHTKTGEILAIARVEKKLGHNDFVLMARRAKEQGGTWSRFAKGFLFENRENAEKFRVSENNRESTRMQVSESSLSSIPREKLEQLIDTLKQTGLAVDIVIDEDIRNNPEIKDAQGNVYGYVTPDGVIHLDAQNINANTPIHEFSHLWNDYIKKNNPELYQKGVELIKQSPYYWERIYNNPAYSNLSEERKIDEALAMAIGDKGEGFINRNMKQRFVDWLSDVWKSIKEALGINTDVAIEDMSLSDFTDRAIGELLGGKELSSSPVQNTELSKQELSEIERIKQLAIDNGTYMKAPNGKATNLTERQWLQVRSSNFKEWFGDWENNPDESSKMVDTNGEPQIFYHRTPNEFTVFDASKNGENTDAGWLGDGFYFYGEESESYGYGDKSIEAFLNIREPYYATDQENLELAEKNDREISVEFSDNIRSEGYDGVYYNGDFRQETVVFDPNQIKSATDNVGSFDSNIDDIRFHSVNDVAEANNSTMTEEARIELDLKLKGVIGKIEDSKYAYVLENLRKRGIPVDKLNTTKMREAWEDRYLPVKKFFDVLRNRGVKIDEYNDFYLKATHLSGMNDSQLEVYNETLQKPLNRVIRELQDKEFTYRNVENYAILKHGIERNEWMRQNAIDQYVQEHPDATPEQIERFTNKLPDDYAGVTAVEKEVGMTAEEFITDFEEKAGSKLVDKFWKKVNEATQFSLKKNLEGQLLNQQAYDELTARYKYYVPLRGHDETVAEDRWDYTPQMGTYFVNPLIKANGRRSRSETPFAFIAQQAQSSITASNKNTLNQTILRLANKGKTGLMTVSRAWYELKGEQDGQPLWEQVQAEYSADADTYQKNIEMFEAKMQKLAEAGQAFQSGKKLDIGGLFIKPKQAEQHEVHVYQNGVDYVIYINANPAVAKAINGSNIQDTSKVMKSVAKMSRFMAANFTTRNPIFVATNFSRDYIFASSILPVKENIKYAVQFQKNIPEAAGALQRYIRGKADLTREADRYMMEYIMNGAKTGYSHIVEIQKVQKEIEKDSKKGDKRNIAERVFQVFGAANEFAENLSRFSVYMTSRKEGRSVVRSVSDAKNVTVNFNQSGAGGTIANFVRPAYLFVNAGIQAFSNIAKVAYKNPKKISALFTFYTLTGALIAPALALLLGGDDGLEDYYSLGEWERQNNLCLYTGKGFIKIPLPHELRVFHRMGDKILHTITGKKDITETMIDIPLGFSDLIPIDPMGAVEASWAEVTPDFMKPFTQLWANRNFMGGRIYNEWVDPNTPGYLQARTNKKGKPFAPDILVNTTKTIDNLTGGDGVEQGFISLNPDLVEHFARGYFGGLYSTAMQSINFTSKLAGFNKSGDITVRDTPLKTFFTSNEDLHVSSSSMNKKYFDIKDEIKEIRRKIKGYENQANKGDISVEDFAKKISNLATDIEKLQRVYPLMQEIDKYEKALKELDGEDQKKIERHISDWKKQVIEINSIK